MSSTTSDPAELTGLAGLVADLVSSMGALGVGLLTALETVFPPIPSEVVLPLAGFLAQQGRLGLVWVLVASVVGSVAGALVLYGVARRIGPQRATALVARLPLVDADDVERASGWFERHGRAAVFFGRLVPGVRSLISLPAGAQRMPVLQFVAYTTAGSAVWCAVLVGLGYALGTQWQRVGSYADLFGWVVVGVLVLVVVLLAVRRVRRHRRETPTG